jgi:hypothetical protein
MTAAGAEVGSAVTTLKAKYGMLVGAVVVITHTEDSTYDRVCHYDDVDKMRIRAAFSTLAMAN